MSSLVLKATEASDCISAFINYKIQLLHVKLYVQPKEDEEKKVIIEQLLHGTYLNDDKEENMNLSEEERNSLKQQIAVLESYKTLKLDEAFQKISDDTQQVLDNMNVEYVKLTEKSAAEHQSASANEKKLVTLKVDYNKLLKAVYDDDAKETANNKVSKRLPRMKEEINFLTTNVPTYRRNAVRMREEEIAYRKEIERVKKDFDLLSNKYKVLEKKNHTSESGSDSESKSDLVNPKNELTESPFKECWLCEGECTCD
jgi:hypothetical protein